jgi:hypothetical protein
MAVSLQTLQKRARDKEYRLRKKGASFDEVKAASPRVSAKEIAKMTPGQKRSYRAKLENFNKRENRLYVYESGEVDKLAEIQKFQKQAQAYNDKVQARRERIAKKAKGAGLYKDKSVKNESALSGIKFVKADEMPKSKAQLHRFKKGLKRLKQTSEPQRRKRLRMNAKEALNEVGLSDVAEMIDKMSANAFDMLMTYTDFWGAVNSLYVESDVRMGKIEQSSYYSHADNIIFAITNSMKIK